MTSYKGIDHAPYTPREQTMRRGTVMLISTIAVFVALMIVGTGLIVGARSVTDTFDQSALVHVGGAIVGGALAFFLVQIFSYAREFGQFRDQ